MERYELPFYITEKKHLKKPFLRQPFGEKWETYTWGEVGEMARKLAAGLQSLGLRKKAHIAIVSKNCREWVIADLAIMMAGYVSVPFYPTLTASQLNEVITSGDVDAIFVGKLETWEDMKDGVPTELPMISFPHYEGFSKIESGYDWQTFIDQQEALASAPELTLADVWTIVFTSGTTGTPKGVTLTWGNLKAAQDLAYVDNSLKASFDGDNAYFSYLPLNHLAERIVVAMNVLKFGGTMSFAENLDRFFFNLRDTRPTLFFAVPRIWTKFQMGILSKMPQSRLNTLLKIPFLSTFFKKRLLAGLGLDRTRATLTGAAPMPEAQKDWYRKIDLHIMEGYGQTETCAIGTTLKGADRKPGSVGKPPEGTLLKIAPETNEILFKAPWVMKGYYKNPEKTAETIKDGWLHTGDEGRLDEEGYLYITGRIKDTFKTSKGKFIVPAPIEWEFAHNSDIELISIVGLGCPQPLALVMLSELGIAKSKEALKSSLQTTLKEVNEKMPNYRKVSTLIVTKDAWTIENGLLTPTMKVKRNVMNRRYKNQFMNWHEAAEDIVFEKA